MSNQVQLENTRHRRYPSAMHPKVHLGSICIWCLRPSDDHLTPRSITVDGVICCDNWCARSYQNYCNIPSGTLLKADDLLCTSIPQKSRRECDKAPHFGTLEMFGGPLNPTQYQALKTHQLDRPSDLLLVPHGMPQDDNKLDARLQQVTQGFYSCLRKVYKTEEAMQEALVHYGSAR